MSEQPEASNRHLASTTESQQQQQDICSSTAPPAKSNRRKRPSTSSNDTITTKRSTSSRSRFDINKTVASDTKPGPPYTVQQSSANPKDMSSINLTKTGRVSKAKKGLKVHDCECGRSYTRAEHLRRHQRNHAKEGAMVCGYPSCGKLFYRLDLLQRHEERHNEFGNTSRQPSVSSAEHSAHTSPTTVPAILPMFPVNTLPPTPSYPQQQVSSPQPGATPFPSESKHQSMTNSARHSISGPVTVESIASNAPWHDSFAPSPYSCSSGYATPAPGLDYGHAYASPPYINNVVRTRASSNASFIEQHWVQASQSPTSSAGMPYSWPSDEKSIAVSSFPYTTGSYSASDMPMYTMVPPVTHYGAYDPHNVAQMDAEEGVHLFPGDHYGSFIPLSPSSIGSPSTA
ncbi:hypothetical protein B5807_03779 [Epicoccum nigrum]|uniref:C2H2-type domain-containing protein n=1 Tax=Epicoccum nigrum TaxID=105696 RepID=A0A1Y2M796_EPING|nr:hypothetical protein B5807_03779 [Epicoccum nigrum]